MRRFARFLAGCGMTMCAFVVGCGSKVASEAAAPAGTCTRAATQCVSATEVQSCDDTGHWGAITTCANACVDGACAGKCRPDAKRCSIDMPQRCDSTGAWQDAAAACGRGLCSDGDCLATSDYGFTTGTAESAAPSDSLVAVRVELPAGMLIGLGLITTQTSGQDLIVGLYTDAAGGPSKLVQSSESFTVAKGVNEASVTDTTIAAGTYWIVEASSGTTHFASTGESISVGVTSFAFGPLPVSIVGALPMATGNAPDLYAVVAN